MTCTQSAGSDALVSRNAASEATVRALRLCIGKGRRYSVKEAALATGLSARAIEGYIATSDSSDHRELPLNAFLSLSSFLGSDFANSILRLAGVGCFDIPEGGDGDRLRDIAIEAVQDAGKLIEILADGTVDHTEKPHFDAILDRKTNRLGKLRSVA